MFRLLVAFSGEGLPLERCATVWTVWSAWCNVDGVSTVVALTFYQFLLRRCLLWSCLASCCISTESAIEGVQIVGGSSAYLRDVVHSHILGMIYSLLLASVFLFQLLMRCCCWFCWAPLMPVAVSFIMPAIFIMASI